MTTQKVPISSVRDLITARNALRTYLTEHHAFRPEMHVRATAAITAMVELILVAGANGVLHMTALSQNGHPGIELVCELTWLGGSVTALKSTRQRQLTNAQQRLDLVTDDVQFNNELNTPCLTVQVWSKA